MNEQKVFEITDATQDRDISAIYQHISVLSEEDKITFLKNYFYEVPCFIENTRFLDNIPNWKQNLLLQLRVMKHYCYSIYDESLVSKISQSNIIHDIEVLLEKELERLSKYNFEDFWKFAEKKIESLRYIKYYQYYLRHFRDIPKFENASDENSVKLNEWLLSLNSTENLYFLRNYFDTVPLFGDNFPERVKSLSVKKWKSTVSFLLLEEPTCVDTIKNNIYKYDKNEEILDCLISELRRVKNDKFIFGEMSYQNVKRIKYYKYSLELCLKFYKDNIMDLSENIVQQQKTVIDYEIIPNGGDIPVEFVYRNYKEPKKSPIKIKTSRGKKKSK